MSPFHIGILGHSQVPLTKEERVRTMKTIREIICERWQMYPDATCLWSRGVPYGDLIVMDLLQQQEWKNVYMYSPRNQSPETLELVKTFLRENHWEQPPENLCYQPLPDLEIIEDTLLKRCSAFIFVIRDSSELQNEDRLFLDRIVNADKPVMVIKTHSQSILPLFETDYADQIQQAVMSLEPRDL